MAQVRVGETDETKRPQKSELEKLRDEVVAAVSADTTHVTTVNGLKVTIFVSGDLKRLQTCFKTAKDQGLLPRLQEELRQFKFPDGLSLLEFACHPTKKNNLEIIQELCRSGGLTFLPEPPKNLFAVKRLLSPEPTEGNALHAATGAHRFDLVEYLLYSFLDNVFTPQIEVATHPDDEKRKEVKVLTTPQNTRQLTYEFAHPTLRLIFQYWFDENGRTFTLGFPPYAFPQDYSRVLLSKTLVDVTKTAASQHSVQTPMVATLNLLGCFGVDVSGIPRFPALTAIRNPRMGAENLVDHALKHGHLDLAADHYVAGGRPVVCSLDQQTVLMHMAKKTHNQKIQEAIQHLVDTYATQKAGDLKTESETTEKKSEVQSLDTTPKIAAPVTPALLEHKKVIIEQEDCFRHNAFMYALRSGLDDNSFRFWMKLFTGKDEALPLADLKRLLKPMFAISDLELVVEFLSMYLKIYNPSSVLGVLHHLLEGHDFKNEKTNTDNKGRTLLHWAVIKGDKALADNLCMLGAPADQKDTLRKCSALVYAFECSLNCVGLLIARLNLIRKTQVTAVEIFRDELLATKSYEAAAKALEWYRGQGSVFTVEYFAGNVFLTPTAPESTTPEQRFIDQMLQPDTSGCSVLNYVVRHHFSGILRSLVNMGALEQYNLPRPLFLDYFSRQGGVAEMFHISTEIPRILIMFLSPAKLDDRENSVLRILCDERFHSVVFDYFQKFSKRGMKATGISREELPEHLNHLLKFIDEMQSSAVVPGVSFTTLPGFSGAGAETKATQSEVVVQTPPAQNAFR